MSAQGDFTELKAQVFGNPLIMERIMHFTVHKDNSVCPSSLRTCRLVNSSWLKLVNKVLTKSRTPLFTLNSLIAAGTSELEEFEEMVTASAELTGSFPPISIYLEEEYFDADNYQFTTNCLARLGKGLVGLHFEVPGMGFPQGEKCVKFKFPKLHKLNLTVEWSEYLDPPCEDNESGGNSSTTGVIQSILSGCEQLRHFILSGGVDIRDPLPQGFRNLRLPCTVTKVELDRGVFSEHLRGLMSAPLPKLTSLVLSFSVQPFEEDLIFTLLNKCSHTLKHLTLKGIDTEWYMDMNVEPTTVQLPRMASLETLEVLAGNIQWVHRTDVVTQLPKLKKIKFGNQKAAGFSNWVGASHFDSVDGVAMEIGGKKPHRCHDTSHARMLETCHLMRKSFPNVLHLELNLNLCHTSNMACLHYVFHHFRQIQELRVTFPEISVEEFCPDEWNSLVLGIPQDLVKTLRTQGEDKENWLPQLEQLSSIKNLTELRKLHLCFRLGKYSHRMSTSLKFDTAFYIGLMDMPNLKEVSLQGRFKVSSNIADLWKETGRVLRLN